MENTMLSIYGARLSKDGKRVNITLVGGDKEKVFYTACVKLDNSQKTHVKVNDNDVIVKIPFLKSANNEF